MDIKKIIDEINKIAGEIVEKHGGDRAKLAYSIWDSLWRRFGPTLFGAALDESWTDGLPTEAVPAVEQLAAQIEASDAS